jgi:hypothetical protein
VDLPALNGDIMNTHAIAFFTGVLCFGAMLGYLLAHFHVKSLVPRLVREELEAGGYYDDGRYASEQDYETDFTFEDQEIVAGLARMKDMPEPDYITEMRDTSIRRGWRPQSDTQPPSIAGTIVGAPAPVDPEPVTGEICRFVPDVADADVAPAVDTGWDANLTVDIDDPPEIAARKLALKYFGRDDQSPRELTGSPA